MKDCTAIVLAAGAGKRFWPLSEKVLIPFMGKPFGLHVLEKLPSDVSRVIVVASKDNEAYFRKSALNVPVTVVVQERPLGMADAVFSAAPELSDSAVFVVNADDMIDGSVYSEVFDYARKTEAFATLPAIVPDRYFPGAYLRTTEDKLLDIVEKPDPDKLPGTMVTFVAHFFASGKELIHELQRMKGKTDDLYEQAIRSLAGRFDIRIMHYRGRFVSLKYPWHVLDAMEIFLGSIKNYRGRNVDIKKNVSIEGDVWISDNVRIFENSKIVGPCYIESGTIIGNNNIIRSSHIGRDVITGFGTDISRSYIGDGCWFHSNYIGDSVLGTNVSMGSGTVLANLRLDEEEISSVVAGKKVNTYRAKLGAILGDNVRIGVNASIMPGIKVGSNTMIGAGVVVATDIEADCFVTHRQDIVKEKNLRNVASSDRSAFRSKI